MLENKIQKTSDYLFWFSIGGYVMDQRSWDGRFFRWIKSSRSIAGKIFPIYEILDERIASALNKIIYICHFKKRVSLEEQQAQKEDRFLRGRQIAFMIYDYFRVTGAQDTVLDYADLFSVTLRNDNVKNIDTRWDEVLLSISKTTSDDVLESLYKLRIRESDWLKNCIGIVRHGDSSEDVNAQLSKIENDGAKKKRSETSDCETLTPGMRELKQEQWSRMEREWVALKVGKVHVTSGKKSPVFEGRPVQFPKPTPKDAQPSEPSMTRGRSASRKRSVTGRSQTGRKSSTTVQILFERYLYEITLWVLASSRVSISQKEKWESGCKAGDKCLFPHWKVEEQPSLKTQKELQSSKRKLRRQGCCSKWTLCHFCVPQDSGPSFRKAWSVGETRGIKFWDQFDEYDSQSLRYVKQVPRKWRTIAWKNTSQDSSSVKSLRL